MSTTTETAPECCPFCGAGKKRHLPHIAFRWFECGTMTAPASNNRRDQTPTCADAERERLTRERDEAMERVASAIADRDTARGRAEQVWKLREEFVALLGTDDIQKGVETVRGLLARVKRLEEALEACAAIIGPRDKVTWATDEQVDHAWELYTKAKEAKP